MFLIFVLATLGITYWASKQNKTASDFIPRAAVSQVPKRDRYCRGLYVSGNLLGLSSMVLPSVMMA